MNALVTAIADLIKTFCSGIVSLITVPAQTLHASFGSWVFVLPFAFAALAILLKVASKKKEARPKLLDNLEKGEKK